MSSVHINADGLDLTKANPGNSHMSTKLNSHVATGEGAQGLPVAGYKAVQPNWAADLVNQNKVLEEKILRQIDFHATGPFASLLNQRDVQMARGLIEDAFMRLNRGVFQPKRIEGGLK